MEAGAATPPPDQPEAAVPPPLGEQDAAEREPASQAALEEQAKAVPAGSRTGEGELPPGTLLAGITALRGPLPPLRYWLNTKWLSQARPSASSR